MVCTHWSGDWRKVDHRIARIPQLGFIGIDAYQRTDGPHLANLFYQGTSSQERFNLRAVQKPTVITEYGGLWGGDPRAQVLAEQRMGPWAGLVSGYATSPMLWWFEWVDQSEEWGCYRAAMNFLAGEDLRSTEDSPSQSVFLQASSEQGSIWGQGWVRPGRLLGYLVDETWAKMGQPDPLHAAATVTISESIRGGRMAIEWWSTEQGRLISSDVIDHAGGRLDIVAPPFQQQLAFKLFRVGDEDQTSEKSAETSSEQTEEKVTE